MYRRFQPDGPPFNDFEVNRDSLQDAGLGAWWAMLASRRSTKIRDLHSGAYPLTLAGTYTWLDDPGQGAAVQLVG